MEAWKSSLGTHNLCPEKITLEAVQKLPAGTVSKGQPHKMGRSISGSVAQGESASVTCGNVVALLAVVIQPANKMLHKHKAR
jgi:hypothetical protein